MDLTDVPGVDAAFAEKLRAAGVGSTAALARAPDVDGLAAAIGVAPGRIDGAREAARQRIVRLFREAGVPDERALSTDDPDALAERTGLSRDDVLWFQAAAREELGRAGQPRVRVLLRAGRATARVDVDGRVAEGVAIVPARAGEALVAALARAPGDAVALAAGADAGAARVGGETRESVPLFHETDAGLVRVRVDDIVERQDKAGLLSRLLRRK